MSDFLDLQGAKDLNTDAIHLSAVANSKDPVTGAAIDTHTNRAGDTDYTLRGFWNAIGPVVMPWTSVTGGTLTQPNQAFLHPGDGNYYSWTGGFPKVVAPGTNPESTAGYSPRTDLLLRPVSLEALRRSYALVGLLLVDGSFELGGTLNSSADVLLDAASGKAYSWPGPFPKIVAPMSAPDGFIAQNGKVSPVSSSISGTELNPQTDAFFNKILPTVKIVAHRGFSFIAMENTIWAYQKAKNLGADWLECDIQVTSDGVPVMFHDDTTDRLMGGSVDVITSPYSAIASMTFTSLVGTAYKNEPIPRLADVCEWLSRNDSVFLAEFKRLRSPADVELIINIVKQYGVTDKFVWQCNDTALLKEARKFLPNCKVLFFSDYFQQDKLDELSSIGNAIYAVQYAALNADSTIGGKCRQAGVELATYTNNNSFTLRNLRKQGLNYIFTDVNLGRLS